MRTCLVAILLLLQATPFVWSDDINDGVERELPADGKLWLDQKTGLRFPQNMGTFKLEGCFEWKEKSLGYSLRFLDPKAQARADIYIYPCAGPAKSLKEQQESLAAELKRSAAGVYLMAEKGAYSDVKGEDGQFEPFKTLPEGEIQLASARLTMKMHESQIKGAPPSPAVSWHHVAIMNGHFIKVRYTYAEGKEGTGSKLHEEFMSRWQWCLREPGFRKMTEKHLSAYFADPLSKEGEDHAGGVVAYADKSPMINFAITERLGQCLKEASEQVKGADLHLLRAFIAGNVRSCWEKETTEDPQAGVAQMMKVYQLLQQQGLKSGLLEKLSAAAAEGKADEWLRSEGKP